MDARRFIFASLRHYRRVHFAVAMGVAVATAVLTGALLVGDSVRGSLRDLTLQRLGRIDSALVAGQTFRETLADELAADANFQKHFASAEPVILTSGTLESGDGQRRATRINVVATRPEFWSLGEGKMPRPLGERDVAITRSLARELDAEVGDEIVLRVPTAGAIPADSPLGNKDIDKLSNSRRLAIAAVLPEDGLGRFGLMPSQHLPRNIFAPLATLQDLLDQLGKANAILVATDHPSESAGEDAHRALEQAIQPKLQDYGLRVDHISSPLECYQISADRLVLPDVVVRAAKRAFGDGQVQPVSTYLANKLVISAADSQRKIPYSTITGVDSTESLGPLRDKSGQPIVLADDEIVLNRWAVDDLHAEMGDSITVTFYEPESTHGRLREHQPPPAFKLRAIVELQTADGQSTPAADPKLTPELPGVTDQESIREWELPFDLVETIRSQDEDYWDTYRTTPKAFLSLATARRLWPSRWGTISLLRVPTSAADSADHLADRLASKIDPATLGMTFLRVKQLGLQSSSGTTPFGSLFLGFSLFLIAAALMLISLLFQLGIQQRAGELGTLAAVGVGKKQIAALLSREGLIVAAIGATAGVALGIAYAWLMITGLRTWWLAAISTPFLELHLTWMNLVLGWLLGVVISWLTIHWSIRRLVKESTIRLLSGAIHAAPYSHLHGAAVRTVWPIMRVATVLLACALCIVGFYLQGEAQAGVFFGSGATVLALLLGETRHQLRHATQLRASKRNFSLGKLSALNTARNPGRSTLTIGLVAAASFHIVAISAFRLETSEAGTGGFDLLATSDQRIHYDLNTPEGRLELGFSDAANRELEKWRIVSLRVAGGEDASCLNLYRPSQPRVLGVPQAFIEHGKFAWAASADTTTENPWAQLSADLGQDERGQPIVPVVLDASTAIYSLHLSGVGSQLTVRDASDQTVTLQVVGLLKNSVLQGNLLVNEASFLRLFPETSGYQFFLLERLDDQTAGPLHGPGSGERSSPASDVRSEQPVKRVAQMLESALADVGFAAVDAREQLAAFLAVQNTYLSTFQSLGGLGLLLGTIGLAVVQLRSVLERRSELALMRAAGFPPARLVRMVARENAVLLFGGLAIGCAAAAVALLPQWVPQEASFPWVTLAVLLGAIGLIGLAAGWLATHSALKAPIVPALRGD